MESRRIIDERLTLPIKGGEEYKADITWKEFKNIPNMLDTDVIGGFEWKETEGMSWGGDRDESPRTIKTPYIVVYRKREETDDEFFKRMKAENEEKIKIENKERLEYLRLKAKYENEEPK